MEHLQIFQNGVPSLTNLCPYSAEQYTYCDLPNHWTGHQSHQATSSLCPTPKHYCTGLLLSLHIFFAITGGWQSLLPHNGGNQNYSKLQYKLHVRIAACTQRQKQNREDRWQQCISTLNIAQFQQLQQYNSIQVGNICLERKRKRQSQIAPYVEVDLYIENQQNQPDEAERSHDWVEGWKECFWLPALTCENPGD